MSAPQSVRSFDVLYAADVNLMARLYLPPGRPAGAMVDVHGGGWVSGDRHANRVIAEALAAAGVLVMSIDVRKAPADRYPASIADTHLAIRWLKAVSPSFGLSADRVGGLGTSSGAHQLLLATLCADDERYAGSPLPAAFGDQSAALAFLVLGWPVADPLERYRMVLERQDQQLIDAHHGYWPDEAAMADGNPKMLLDRRRLARLPPALVLQGTSDKNLPTGSALRLAESYEASGGRASLAMFEGGVHAFVTRDPQSDAARAAMAMIVDFVLDQLGEARGGRLSPGKSDLELVR